MLNVVTLSIVMLSVVMLSVVAPSNLQKRVSKEPLLDQPQVSIIQNVFWPKLQYYLGISCIYRRRHDIQHNDTQPNDIQHNNK
jgi:hypothetical protein